MLKKTIERFYQSKYDVKLKIFWVECIGLFCFALLCSIILNCMTFQPIRMILEIIFMIAVFIIFTLSFSKKQLKPYSIILFFICNLFIILLILLLDGISKITVFSYFALNILFIITGFNQREEILFLFLESLLYGAVIVNLDLSGKDLAIYTSMLIQIIISTSAIMVCFSIILKMYEENARHLENINQELKDAALKDPLTSLWNRNYMNYFFDEWLGRDIDLTVIMFDIDHFKEINDQYGHPIGDEVLRLLSKILTSLLPDNAVAVRYGGEEFLVILPYYDLENATSLAEKIRKTIRKELVIKGIKRDITISGGISERHKKMPRATLIKNADEKLYVAKKNGRNQIVF